MIRRVLSRLRAGWSPPADPVRLTLYTRPDCPLCDAMVAAVERARLSRPIEWVRIDIGSDPALEARHGRSIPVLEIEGRAAFKGGLTVPDLERKFERRVRAAGQGGRA